MIITICIVDDQPILRQALEDIVNSSSNLSCIGSFADAESYINEYDNLKPDITLMDIDLPGMSGIEAIQVIKLKDAAAKFLVLTIFNNDDKVFNAIKSGAGGYLLKKYSFDYLLENIMELHAGGAPMSPEIARRVINYFQRGSGSPKELNSLTDREKMVLELIVDGFLYKEIANKLAVTIDTVKKHASSIYEKLHVRTRSEAIKKYLSR
ncbi:MAG: response regulator transcription factor [Chitinophagaceae bacterium]|nr:response regulator transcription factor [Chitinophagaceae bacterium]